MAEALAVISIIANVLALIEFGGKVFERTQRIGGNVRDVPKAFRDVHTKLSLVKSALQNTRERLLLGQIREIHKEGLERLLSELEKKIIALNTIFTKYLPEEDDSRTTRMWKAISSVRQDKKVEAIDKAIMSYVGSLAYYHSSESASATQVTEAIRGLNVKAEEPPRKPLFMVRYQKEQAFVGRTMIMEHIERRFAQVSRVAITGIGGVGKSRIAIEYCYQYRSKNPDVDVFWVHGGSKARVEAAYKDIATQMKIPGINNPNVNTMQIVSDWLSKEENGSWLMVLDNADDPNIWTNAGPPGSSDSTDTSIRLADYIPRGNHGSLLITTRNTYLGEIICNNRRLPIEVPIFGSGDAVALLRSKLPLGDEVTDEDAIELTKSLDHLPLAITQASAFLTKRKTSVTRYLELVKSSKAETSELLSHENPDLSRDPDIHNSVFQTWKISFDQVSRQAPRAADMLSLMAVLDRQAIAVDLLRLEDEKELDFIDAIEELKAFSLIVEESKSETYSMHRIVQLSIQWHLETQERLRTFQEKALCCVDRCFPPDGKYEHWSSIEALNPHAQIVLSYEFVEESFQIRRARLMYILGDYNSARGLHSIAVECLSDSVKLYESNHDSKNPDYLKARHVLAFCLSVLGRIEDAEREVHKAIDMLEISFSKERYPEVIGGYALILSHKGEYEKSERLFKQALELSTTQYGSTHLETFEIMHNLAVLHAFRCQFSEAENLCRDLVTIRLKTVAVEHPDTIMTMVNLADALGSQCKFEEEEELLREVLSLQTRVLGASNPQTLRSMHDLTHCLYNLGRIDEAEILGRETLKLRIKILGAEDKSTLMTMHNLANTLRESGKYSEAEEYFKETLRLRTKVLGIENKSTITTIHQLAFTLAQLEKYDKALEYYKEALRLRTKVLGAEHEHTLVTMHNLVWTFENLGNYEEAKKLGEKCLELRVTVLGIDHPHTIWTKDLLAEIYTALELKKEEALSDAKVEPSTSDPAVLEPGDEVSRLDDDAEGVGEAQLDEVGRGIAQMTTAETE